MGRGPVQSIATNYNPAFRRYITLLCLFSLIIVIAILVISKDSKAEIADHIVISEWTSRGPGGSTDEFLELYNPTDESVDVSGWAIITYNASSLFCPDWCERKVFPGDLDSGTVVIPPKRYFLVADSCGSYTGPTPDLWFICTVGFKDDNGTIRLVKDYGGSNTVVDTVAYEAFPVRHPDEKGARLWMETETTSGRGYSDDSRSVVRKASASSTSETMDRGGSEHFEGNGWDSDDNDADFFISELRQPQGLSFMEQPLHNQIADTYHSSFQEAVNTSSNGESFYVNGPSYQYCTSSRWGSCQTWANARVDFHEDVVIDGKNLNIINSTLNLVGDLSLVNGATLTLDPTTWNMAGNIYVGNGSTLVLDDTLLQMGSASHGEYGIRVNETGLLIVRNASIIKSETGYSYRFHIQGRVELTGSRVEDMSSLLFDNAGEDSLVVETIIKDWTQAGIMLNNTNLTVANSTLSGSGSKVWLYNDAHLTLVNTTYDDTLQEELDNESHLTVLWYLDVKAIEEDGRGIVNATVFTIDYQLKRLNHGGTDTHGWLRGLLLVEFVATSLERSYHTPYNIYMADGPLHGVEVVRLDHYQTINVESRLARVQNLDLDTRHHGIMPAVMAANPGDRILVSEGQHNESVTLELPLHLMGISNSTTTLHGDGANQTIHLMVEGVTISDLRIENVPGCEGVKAIAGGFEIFNSSFELPEHGILVDIRAATSGATSVGNISVHQSTFTDSLGVRVRELSFVTPTPDSDLRVGDISIAANTFTGPTGIILGDLKAQNLRNGTLTWGDITVMDNHLNNTGKSIQVWAHVYNLTNVEATLGHLLISGNEIISNDTGIQISAWQSTLLSGTTRVVVRGLQMEDNRVEARVWGINFIWNAVGHKMYDSSSVEVLGSTVSGNNLSASFCLSLQFSHLGYQMENETTFTMASFEVRDNQLHDGDYGLSLSYLTIARELQDNSSASLGRFRVWNNTAWNLSYGMIIDMREMACLLYDQASATFGDVSIDSNHILNSDMGLSFQYQFNANSLFNQSQAHFQGTSLEGNRISVVSRAIDLNLLNVVATLEGEAEASFGTFKLNNNVIISDWEGMRLSYSGMGTDLKDEAYVNFTGFEFDDNHISAGMDPLRVMKFRSVGRNMEGASLLELAKISFDDNLILSRDNGMDLELSYFGSDLKDEARVNIGAIQIINITVNATSASALHIDMESFGDDLHDEARFELAEILLDENVLSSGGDGLVMELEQMAYRLYNESSVSFEKLVIQDQYIRANGSALIIGTNHYGAMMNGESGADLGSWELERNTLECVSGLALHIHLMGTGLEVKDHSRLILPELGLRDNHIVSGSEGVDLTLEGGGPSQQAVVLFPDMALENNTVEAHLRAFGLFTDIRRSENSPRAFVDPGQAQISGNRFTADHWGGTLLAFGLLSPTLELEDNQFLTSESNGTGLYLKGIQQADLLNCTLKGWNTALILNNSIITAQDLSLLNTTDLEVQLSNSSTLTLVSTHHNSSKVEYRDERSTLELCWLLDLSVELQNGLVVPRADIQLRDSFDRQVFLGQTDGKGQLHDLRLVEYRERLEGAFYFGNPFNLTATRNGTTGWLSPELWLEDDMNVTLTIHDLEAPVFGSDLTPVGGTTGEPFQFQVEVADGLGLEEVTVEYWWGEQVTLTQRSLSPGPTGWSVTVNLADDWAGDLNYQFTARDLVGNEALSASFVGQVVDGQAPGISDDVSDTVAFTGDLFQFMVNITDNVGVASTEVSFWFDDGVVNTSLMLPHQGVGTDSYQLNLTLPLNATTLSYRFLVRDLVDNLRTGPLQVLAVADNDRPHGLRDGADSVATTGESFEFKLQVEDNLGLGSVAVHYRFGQDTATNLLMTPGGADYSISIRVPEQASGDLSYLYEVTDTSGNRLTSVETVATLVDDDLPVILMDATSESAVKSRALEFAVLAKDNQGIKAVRVVYGYEGAPDGNQTLDLELVNGTYTGTLKPERKGTLVYHVEVEDMAGNLLTGESQSLLVASGEAAGQERPYKVPFILFLLLTLGLAGLYLKDRLDLEGDTRKTGSQATEAARPSRPRDREDSRPSDDDREMDDEDEDEQESEEDEEAEEEYQDQ